MRRLILLLAGLAAALGSADIDAARATSKPSSPGSGSPACLRGHWVASRAETSRVAHALVPIPGMQVNSKLYMQFRDGFFQYGTPSITITMGMGGQSMTARARFYTLQRYTARRGVFTTSAGESHIEYGPMSATKDGRTYTVAGPPPKTSSIPGGSTPFRCRGNSLQVKLPRFASMGWITLQRG